MIRPTLSLLLALGLCAPLTACIGFGGGEDDCILPANGSGDGQAPVQPRRNPENGECIAVGGGGGGGGGGNNCDFGGDPAPENRPAPLPDMALCYQQCEGLNEDTCRATTGCRAIYVDTGTQNDFYECWGVAQPFASEEEECEGLDAYRCSHHDNCIAVHNPPGAGGGNQDSDRLVVAIGLFESCHPETDNRQVCSDSDPFCGEGFHCSAPIDCLPNPDCGIGTGGSGDEDPAGVPQFCDPGCFGFCQPNSEDCSSLDELACSIDPNCQPIYEGINCECPGTVCECEDQVFEECIDIDLTE